MNDADTTLSTLKDCMAAFVRERDWEQFHAPKNLAMSIAIEAAELMERFQWLTPEQSCVVTPEDKGKIQEEIADVVIYALYLCNRLSIDLTGAILAKTERNAARYPAHLVRGRADHTPSEGGPP